MTTVKTGEPFDLSGAALERIARDAGAEDANVARRILRAYWFSKEREARDLAIAGETIRRLEIVLRRELPREALRRGESRRPARPGRGPMPSVGPRRTAR